jgi:hypothetical protein
MVRAAPMVNVNCFVAVTDAPSVTVTRIVNGEPPELVGVPVSAPVDELSVTPVGSDPLVTLQV